MYIYIMNVEKLEGQIEIVKAYSEYFKSLLTRHKTEDELGVVNKNKVDKDFLSEI